ncbi:MAG: hypothetical protein HWN67_23635 [Candidatus Helarchaeota archaeon]|nr:hypothetical protein [Candidatus Helarchaeota archaeon]
MSVQLHNVLDEGDLEQVPISGPINVLLKSDLVVLVVDEIKKKIYIWKGENARVRRKFIAARKSQDLRGQLGLTYKVDSIDQGSEPTEFINIIGGPVPITPEIEEFIPTEQPAAPQPTLTPQPTVSPPPQPVSQPTIIQPAQPIQPPQPQPQPTIVQPQPTIEPAPTTQPVAPATVSTSIQSLPVEDSVKQIIAIIDQKSVPQNYEREIVVIGPYVFSMVESKKTFLGQEKIERKWEIFSDLPEGDFLAKDYTARMIVNEGRIMAVELLKGSTEVLSGAQVEAYKIKFQK